MMHTHSSVSPSPLPPQLSSTVGVTIEPSSSGSSSAIDSLSTTPDNGGIVATTDVDEVDVDSMVEAAPNEAKAALRQQLRKTLADLEMGKSPTDFEPAQSESETVQGVPEVPAPTPLRRQVNELQRNACELLDTRSAFHSLKSTLEPSRCVPFSAILRSHKCGETCLYQVNLPRTFNDRFAI